MKIVGNTVGTTMPKPNLMQNDPSKGDYVKGREEFAEQVGGGGSGAPGKDGVSATHEWNGTVLTITSASGTSSADLKGEKGEDGKDGAPGADGKDYALTEADKQEIAELTAPLVDVPQGGGGGSAEWTHLQTVELTENTYSVTFNLANIADVQEVCIVCNTKQNRTDGTAVTNFSRAKVTVNNTNLIGNINNFSAHESFWRYPLAIVHLGKKAGYVVGAVSVEGTDSSIASPVYGTGLAVKADTINNVGVYANYVYANGAVVNGFCAGSTFECYYR